jgi:alkylation response protein AidB-like acyl-CoA dehydrogenase
MPLGEYLLDARVTTLYEGTGQIPRVLIGRGLPGVVGLP